MTELLIVPIHSYVGKDTSLEVNQDLQGGETFIIVEKEDGEVTSVDYGYNSVDEAKAVAKQFEAGKVITPKNNFVG